MPYLFCNIGWMENYNGLSHTKDKLIGGGKWVVKNKTGNEVCNFLPCRDMTYGHVESVLGGKDTQIRIEKLGATKLSRQFRKYAHLLLLTNTHAFTLRRKYTEARGLKNTCANF